MKVFEYISEVSTPTGAIYLRFKERMANVPPGASGKEKEAAKHLTAFAGFANTPAELTRDSARLKFNKLNNMQDIVNMVKSIMGDKVFISAKKMTIFLDLPESTFKRHPYLNQFINWAIKNGGDKIDVEWKDPDEPKAKGLRKKTKPNPMKGKKIRDIDPADPKYTVTFTVGDRFYREIERRLPNLMKYRGPGGTFVMPNEIFMAFRKQAEEKFPGADIKIVKRSHTAEEGTAPTSRPEWDRTGGHHGLDEAFLGILGVKEKEHIKHIASVVSDIPGNWDFKNNTFTDEGWNKLRKVFKGNKNYINYAMKKYGSVNEEFKNTYSVGDRVETPQGSGTIVTLSKNINVDGKVRVKLDHDDEFGDNTYTYTTTNLKHIDDMDEGPASRSLCRSKKPDSALGASQLSSCISQGLRSHKSGRADYVDGKKLKVSGKKIKGKKYGGPLPDYS